MKRTNRRMGFLAATLLAGGMMLSAPVLAGPPLICFPYETGGAKSLPWGKDAFAKASSYSTSNLVKDTLALLKSESSVLARMETLRRAALYSRGDKQVATELLAKLGWIALDLEAAGKPSATAWFDAGFLAACYEQLNIDLDCKPGEAEGRGGYAWIKKAISLEPESGEMHFAAALAMHGKDKVFQEHLRQAVVAAEPGSNLARSLENNDALGKKSLKDLRKSYGISDASSGGR